VKKALVAKQVSKEVQKAEQIKAACAGTHYNQ